MNGMSITHLIAQASLLAQIVLLLLIGASVVSWYVIFSKRGLVSRMRSHAEKFEDRF